MDLENLKSWSAALSAIFSAGFGLFVTIQNQAIDSRLKELEASGKRAEIAGNFSDRLGKEGGILANQNDPEKEVLAISAMYALVADDSNPTYRNIIRRTVYKLGSTLGKVHLIELEADTCKFNQSRCKEEINPRDALIALNELDVKAKQKIGSAAPITDQAIASGSDKGKDLSRLQNKVIQSIETIQQQQGTSNESSSRIVANVNNAIDGVIHLGNLQDTVADCSRQDFMLTPGRVNPRAKSYRFESPEDERVFLALAKHHAVRPPDTNSFVVAIVRETNVRRDYPTPSYNPSALPDIKAIMKPQKVSISDPRIRISVNGFCSLWARVRSR